VLSGILSIRERIESLLFRESDFCMDKEKAQHLKELAYYSSLGFQVSLSIVIGLAIGVWLDREVFDTSPWLTLLFLGFGIAAGFRNIGLAIKKSRKY